MLGEVNPGCPGSYVDVVERGPKFMRGRMETAPLPLSPSGGSRRTQSDHTGRSKAAEDARGNSLRPKVMSGRFSFGRVNLLDGKTPKRIVVTNDKAHRGSRVLLR